MKLNLNKFLFSISFALDLAENQITNVSRLHSKRVAFISIQLANTLGLSDEEKFDLYAYALMHDNGLVEAFTKRKKENPELKNIVIDENLYQHCIIGEVNIKHFPFLTDNKDIILYHHERYDGKGFFKIKGDDIPLMAQIIYFANMMDEQFDLANINLQTKEKIETYVKQNENKLFSPTLVKAFIDLSSDFAFWGSLEYFDIVNRPDKLLKNFEIDISLDQFHEIVEIYSNIIDAKSEFTAKHTQDIADKTAQLIDHLGFDAEHKKKLLIAANLHDIGKLATPIEILEKEGPLDENELFEIRKHAYFTFTILEGIEFSDEILKWASQHHEKPDGSGYPFGLEANDLSLEARFVACIDFYQALTEDRPYRDPIPHKQAITIMKDNLDQFDLDSYIIKLIDDIFQEENESL